MPAGAFTLSKYLQSLQLDDQTVAIAHGLRLQRTILDVAIHDALMLFREQPMTLEDFVEAIELEGTAQPRDTLANLFRSFADKGFIVPADADEDEPVRAGIRARMVSSVPFEAFQIPQRMALEQFELAQPLARHLSVLQLGGCLVQLVEEPLRALAPSLGLTVSVRSGWLTDLHLLEGEPPDIVVLQPGVHRILAPLWAGKAFFQSDEQRRSTLDTFRREIVRIIDQFDSFGGSVLVQGLSTLQMPPHGRADFRLPTGHQRIVEELNQAIRERIAGRPNMMFVDEERLAGNHGKSALMDDMINVAAHHGALDAALPQLLAREFLACYLVLSGLRRIKCVVVDLDNTLWAGVVGEDEAPNPRALPFAAIHEALKILKQRGIVLASCSRNNRDDVLRFWARFDDDDTLLHPDDFVLHCINWDPKSQNLAAIMEKLGLAADAVLFIDDNPVELAEVKARFPALRVLGEKIGRVRAALLEDPCLQPNLISAEARDRTATTVAQLAREEARHNAGDERSFLASLDIRLNVARVRSRLHLDRLLELSSRTNQFNTTLIRYDVHALEAHLASSDGSLWALAAHDRFASYGLVGMCVVDGDRIENLSISCRTIGLGLDQPFLATVLKESGLYRRRVIGRIVEGERNHPCRRVFVDARFVSAGDGAFMREPTPSPPAIDDAAFQVSTRDEHELLHFD
jgi:FkbH-like protein